GIENHIATGASSSSAGESRLNRDRAAGKVRAVGEVEGVEALEIGSAVFRHGDDVDGSVRTGVQIDDRGRGDANFRRDLAAAVYGVAGRLAGRNHGNLPQLREAVRVKCVDGIVFSHDEDDVVRHAANLEAGYVEWFSIHATVGGKEAFFPEA